MLQLAAPLTGQEAVERACRLVIVAEIVTRWPAQQRLFRRTLTRRGAPPQRGLTALAAAASDDRTWNATIAKLGAPLDDPDTSAAVRHLLQHYDGLQVATVYATLI